jgi:exodeoxyribonuclease VII small subunit
VPEPLAGNGGGADGGLAGDGGLPGGGGLAGHGGPAAGGGGDPEQMTFEQLVAALEALTDRLASGQIGIEDAADLYEQAERLHRLATQRLAKVQARIDALGVRPAGA